MKNYTIFMLVFTLLASCSKSDDIVDYKVENEEEIVAFIAANNLADQKSSSGLYYVIDEPGTGKQPTTTSNVTGVYKGYFTNGTIFDPGKEGGISFDLQGVIKGWTEGITYFKEGGKGMLLIPAHLGYGAQGRTGIPGGAVLLFDIQLISVN